MKVRSLLLMVAVTLLAMSTLAACAGSEDVPLKYNLQAGDTFTYDLGLTLNGEVTGGGIAAEQGALPEDTNLQMRMTMAVKDVSDGVTTLTYSYDSLEMTAGGQQVPVTESTIPEITIKVDESGKVLSIEGLEQALPPGLSLSQLPFDPSQFAGQTNLVFPEGGLAKPGDTWEATSTYPIPGSEEGLQSKSTGKLLSVSEQDGVQVAEVEFTVNTPMELTLDLGAMIKEMGLDQLIPGAQDMGELAFKLTMNGGQDMQGVSRIDTNSGMPLDMSADLDVDMEIEVIDAPAEMVPEDQRGPISIDIQAELTLQQVK